MAKKDSLWNSVFVVLAIFTVGSGLILYLGEPLQLAANKIRGGKGWLCVVAGIAYVVGFLVTRVVELSYDATFAKPPFSDIGQKSDKGEAKHPAWIDHLLRPLGCMVFLVRAGLIILVLAALLRGGLWLIVRPG